jgi:hypothetical protein
MLLNYMREGWKYLTESDNNLSSSSEISFVNGRSQVYSGKISELSSVLVGEQGVAQESAPSSISAERNPIVRSKTINVTVNDLNQVGNKVIINSVADRDLRVVGFVANVSGAFTGLTSIIIETIEESNRTIATLPQTILTDGASILPASTSVTLANLGVNLGSVGLRVSKVGGLILTGASVNITVLYIEEKT